MKLSEKQAGFVYTAMAIIAVAVLITAVRSLVHLGDTLAADAVVVMDQSEGPLYDLPQNVSSYIATERSTNRAYIVVESDRGIAITPYLDEDGKQVIIDRP